MLFRSLLERQLSVNLNPDDSNARRLTYVQAIREALDQALERDNRMYVMGQGVNDAGGYWGATNDLYKKHGEHRVFETPLSENGMTGVAVGSAAVGMRPFYCHNRPDFLLLAMDQIINHASKWSFMYGGNSKAPITIWAITGRGWGSGPQHSQAFHGALMHFPGLKIVMPSTPYDAKGMIISAIADDSPVLILEHRWCFNQSGVVPEEPYSIPFGKGFIRREGGDVTIAAVSQMVMESMKAAEQLAEQGIQAEVIDMRTIKPLDEEIVLESVRKTGRLIVADTGWTTAGFSSELAAIVSEKAFHHLKHPVKRVACPDIPTPSSYALEEGYYQSSADIKAAALAMLQEVK